MKPASQAAGAGSVVSRAAGEDSKRGPSGDDGDDGLLFDHAKHDASLGFPIEIATDEQPRALAASELLEKRRALLAQAHAMLSALVRVSPPDESVARGGADDPSRATRSASRRLRRASRAPKPLPPRARARRRGSATATRTTRATSRRRLRRPATSSSRSARLMTSLHPMTSSTRAASPARGRGAVVAGSGRSPPLTRPRRRPRRGATARAAPRGGGATAVLDDPRPSRSAAAARPPPLRDRRHVRERRRGRRLRGRAHAHPGRRRPRRRGSAQRRRRRGRVVRLHRRYACAARLQQLDEHEAEADARSPPAALPAAARAHARGRAAAGAPPREAPVRTRAAALRRRAAHRRIARACSSGRASANAARPAAASRRDDDGLYGTRSRVTPPPRAQSRASVEKRSSLKTARPGLPQAYRPARRGRSMTSPIS